MVTGWATGNNAPAPARTADTVRDRFLRVAEGAARRGRPVERRGLTGLTAELLTVGVDIGGTKIAAGCVTADGVVVDRTRRRTPGLSTAPSVVEDTILDAVDELAGRNRVHAVGIAAAGFVAADRRTVLFAPHLSWRREPLRDALYRRLRLPVVVENDANASAWGEWRFGAGRGEDQLLVVNLGTGIGGAVVVGGLLQRGRFGLAGEFGHMQVVPGGHRCECGNRGCWEQYASGNALVREARSLAASGSPMAHALLQAADGDPSRITGPLVSEVAGSGDPAAAELFAEVGQWLGVGVANLVAAYDPGRVVIGGGVSEAGDLLLAPTRRAFRASLTGRGFRPEAEVVAASLGNDAGVVGAADLARPFARRLARARYRREQARGAADARRAGRSG
ncbi:ROK family glucokinase [Aquipuribacter sp. MA13-6]|uniref:ROK family glucokinase n=1 Tax=unclassified Aquipuribacter TaxID=2635084 RepID=UPI003EED43E7